jgi:hypothetical protein
VQDSIVDSPRRMSGQGPEVITATHVARTRTNPSVRIAGMDLSEAYVRKAIPSEWIGRCFRLTSRN